MFNSQILDVAIGLIFVYLLLSLICSAANEIIEIALKKRAIDLERGIRELLVPDSDSGTADVVQKLYNHPLINGLFGGLYEESRIGGALRYVWRTKLPTYIPSRSFALALMDLILPGQPGPAPDTPSSGASGAAPPTFDVKLDTIPPPPLPISAGSTLDSLRSAVGTNALFTAAPQAQHALITLIDSAGNDAAKARQNIEDWYNASMDRVSGWYKRRAQLSILIIGFIVVVFLNADSVAIVKALNADKNLRELVVAQATKYADQAASSPAPDCGKDKDKDSPQCKLEQSKKQLEALGLPLGWKNPDDATHQLTWADFWKAVPGHLLGWLLTAIAISLGAPFWFDLLNKFIVVRSTVKPKEKSPEEKSKD